MHKGCDLSFFEFDSEDNPLTSLAESQQRDFICAYLRGAGARSVMLEGNYFDRDYLDEFAAFYSRSAKGYKNICRRVHFFSESITRDNMALALGGEQAEIKKLQTSYLGFIILRPLDESPFGRTVLAWYKNQDESSERINTGVREYTCNVLGLKLVVSGIPWQQQDRGVSACATIALWSMFHSSAFDANHSIPTTVEITKNALGASPGRRAFPSNGLTIHELLEAIHAQKLTPKLVTSDGGFDVKELASMCASNIRSGYPVLLVGKYVHGEFDEQHAICCVGFREKAQAIKPSGTCSTMDDETEVFYVHDDNIGPNVRCQLIEQDGKAVLKTVCPAYLKQEDVRPTEPHSFQPQMIIIAAHEEVRMDSIMLADCAKFLADGILSQLSDAYESIAMPAPAIAYNSQFCDVRTFFSKYLEQVLGEDRELLARVRMDIGKLAPPFSLHIGLVRIAVVDSGIKRIIDVIYDTTDCAASCPVLAHIIYDPPLKLSFLDFYPKDLLKHYFGAQILAYK